MAEDTKKTADEGFKDWNVLTAAELPHDFHADNQGSKNKLKPQR